MREVKFSAMAVGMALGMTALSATAAQAASDLSLRVFTGPFPDENSFEVLFNPGETDEAFVPYDLPFSGPQDSGLLDGFADTGDFLNSNQTYEFSYADLAVGTYQFTFFDSLGDGLDGFDDGLCVGFSDCFGGFLLSLDGVSLLSGFGRIGNVNAGFSPVRTEISPDAFSEPFFQKSVTFEVMDDVSVPEPASVLGLLIASAVGVGIGRTRKQTAG